MTTPQSRVNLDTENCSWSGRLAVWSLATRKRLIRSRPVFERTFRQGQSLSKLWRAAILIEEGLHVRCCQLANLTGL
jgi:hypothetical protein